MCEPKNQKEARVRLLGENCPLHPDGMHRLTVHPLALLEIFSESFLTCLCQLECTLLFNAPVTVGALALPYWMAQDAGECGHTSMRSLLAFSETYRSSICRLAFRYPSKGYDS